MVTSDRENSQIGGDQQGIVHAAQQFLMELAPSPERETQVAEGEAIADILDPLGLPASLRAAVLLYPLARRLAGVIQGV